MLKLPVGNFSSPLVVGGLTKAIVAYCSVRHRSPHRLYSDKDIDLEGVLCRLTTTLFLRCVCLSLKLAKCARA